MKKKEFNQLNKIQRTQLEVGLKYHKSLSSLAKEIGVSRQTLYREILRNSYTTIHDSTGLKQSCINFKQCRKEIKGLQELTILKNEDDFSKGVIVRKSSINSFEVDLFIIVAYGIRITEIVGGICESGIRSYGE